MPSNRIGTLRREQNMNQKELGEYLGVGQTTVSAWETEKTEPDSSAMDKMAQLFHVSIGYLMGYEEESSTRGLPQAQYDAYIGELLAKREQRHLEAEIEKMQALENGPGLTPEVEDDMLYAHCMEQWNASGRTDTLEGFLVSRVVDSQPKEMRVHLLDLVERIAKGPQK